MTQTTVHRILKKDLHMIPYKRMKAHGLRPKDPPRRADMGEIILDLVSNLKIINIIFLKCHTSG